MPRKIKTCAEKSKHNLKNQNVYEESLFIFQKNTNMREKKHAKLYILIYLI